MFDQFQSYLFIFCLLFITIYISNIFSFSSDKQHFKLPSNIEICLSNKTIHFMGNSISRGRAFILKELLDYQIVRITDSKYNLSDSNYRKVERLNCTKHYIHNDSILYNEPNCIFNSKFTNTNIIFSIAQSVYSESIQNQINIKADIKIINLNSRYIFQELPNRFNRSKIEVIKLSNAIQLSNHSNFWYFTSTRLCPMKSNLADRDRLTRYNLEIPIMNEIILSELIHVDQAKLKLFDAWNSNDELCHFYDDHVHSRDLARRQLTNWLTLECVK